MWFSPSSSRLDIARHLVRSLLAVEEEFVVFFPVLVLYLVWPCLMALQSHELRPLCLSSRARYLYFRLLRHVML